MHKNAAFPLVFVVTLLLTQGAMSQTSQPDETSPIKVTKSDLQFLVGGPVGRAAQGFQYQYQYAEQPQVVVVTQNGANKVLPNPEHNLNQHSFTFDFKQVFLSPADFATALQSYYNVESFKAPIDLSDTRTGASPGPLRHSA